MHVAGRENGQADPLTLVVYLVIGIVVIALLVYTITAFFRSPSTLKVTEISRTTVSASQQTITFSVTATYSAAIPAGRTDSVDIQEYDPALDDTLVSGLPVTVPAGSATGTSGPFTLTCTVNSFFFGSKLQGPNGSSDLEEDHEIYAEYQRFLLWDIESPSETVNCQQ